MINVSEKVEQEENGGESNSQKKLLTPEIK